MQLHLHHQSQVRASLVLSWWSCRRGVKSSIPLVNIIKYTLHEAVIERKRAEKNHICLLVLSFRRKWRWGWRWRRRWRRMGWLMWDFELSSTVTLVTDLSIKIPLHVVGLQVKWVQTGTWLDIHDLDMTETVWMLNRQIIQYTIKETKFKRILKSLYICLNISSVGLISMTALCYSRRRWMVALAGKYLVPCASIKKSHFKNL